MIINLIAACGCVHYCSSCFGAVFTKKKKKKMHCLMLNFLNENYSASDLCSSALTTDIQHDTHSLLIAQQVWVCASQLSGAR